LFRNCILFILKGNCDSFDSLLDFCFIFIVQFLFASQMWAARPHLASIFEKLLEQKTFYFQQRFPPTLYKIQNLC